MGTLKLNTTSGGSVSIQAADGASDNTVTLPAVTGANIITSADSGTVTQGMIASGVVGKGPAFSAYQSSSQTIANSTYTKILFQTEDWDTNSNYDTSTSRFTPTVAGYYQINTLIGFSPVGATEVLLQIYKNGGVYKNLNDPYASSISLVSGSCVVYLNGSTDYIEIYAIQFSGVSKNTGAVSVNTWFQGHLVRAA